MLKTATRTAEVLCQVMTERRRQRKLFGQQQLPDGTGYFGSFQAQLLAKVKCRELEQNGLLDWRHVLQEEVLEAFAESDLNKLETELVQVAAVAVAWVEDIRRRQGR